VELVCLSVCVVSLWLPGSPFDPSSYFDSITLKKWVDDFLGSFDIHLAQASVNSTSGDTSNGLDWSSWTVNGQSVASLLVLFGGVSLGRF
ncbi:solute carrier family 40member 1, partial [Aphelenchoides avenae]